MATYIKTLKEDNGDITYPQTKAEAVLLNNGSDLETELSQYVTAEEIGSTASVTPAITTSMIADEAVTASKIDFTTMPFATAYTDTKTDSFSGRVPYSAFTQNNGFTLSNNGLVCPKSGYYVISARLSSFGTGGWLRIHVSSSTSTTTVATIVASAIDRRASGVYHTVNVTPTIAYVTQGQYIYAYQIDAGVDLNSGMDAGIKATVLTAMYIGG